MKKPLFYLITITTAISLFLAACGPANAGLAISNLARVKDPAAPPADVKELVAGNTVFALDLYKALRSEDGNLFYSPYSISLALAMTYAGARGDTAAQMASALHFTLPEARLHLAFNALDLGLENPAGDTESKFVLNIVNSLWGQKDWSFLPEFLDTLAANYGAGMRLQDFRSDPEKARQAINAWVAEQTKDKIKDLIPQGLIDPTTVLVLVNAIYFKAAWEHEFSESLTQPAPFTRLDGSQVSVPMMQLGMAEPLPYARGDGWQAVALPYSGGTTEMVILLPDAGGFDQFEQGLDSARLSQVLDSLETNGVILTMPKFSFTGAYQLKKTLSGLGMPLAFDEQQADFSGMDGQHRLFIADVVHKAFVNVDEKGTEAAAATGVVVRPASAMMPEVKMTVDHPFIFLIRDTSTGSILFMGRVLDPGK